MTTIDYIHRFLDVVWDLEILAPLPAERVSVQVKEALASLRLLDHDTGDGSQWIGDLDNLQASVNECYEHARAELLRSEIEAWAAFNQFTEAIDVLTIQEPA